MAQLAQSGVRVVMVAPVFLARGRHVKRDLPELVAQASAKHGLTIRVLPSLCEVDVLLQSTADWIAQAALDE